MKKLKLLAIVMIVGFSASVMAQTTVTKQNSATCKIIAPIGLSADVQLGFGDIIAGAHDVTVSPAGVRTIDATMKAGDQVGTVAAASYGVTGEPLYTYAISLPADEVVTITKDASSIAVSSFNCVSAKTAATDKTGQLTTLGADDFTVGATLEVEGDDVTGAYSGFFDVTVAYN